MPSGFKSGGTDFDDLFDPYVEGQKPALTGYVTDGQDLRDRYAPIEYGSKRADVGFKAGGQDVSNLWAAKGTAVYIRYVLAQSASQTGGSMQAAVNFYAGPDGRIFADAVGVVTTDAVAQLDGSQTYEFRARGTANGQRMAGSATATLTGKGGVNLSSAYPSSFGLSFDTGFHAADSATPLLRFNTTSPPNAALGSWDATVYIDVRKVSDQQIVRTLQFVVSCLSDSQS